MCGFVGFVATNAGDNCPKILDAMTDAIRHRGPNDRGTLVNSMQNVRMTVGLGHRRLSIIDLSEHSHQPMVDSSIALVFNGEIYNYIELRDELIKAGKLFDSQGDTEVVLRAYEQWGEHCFERFNGMWAIAILDKKK